MKLKKNQVYIPDTVYQISIYQLFKNIGITKKKIRVFTSCFGLKLRFLFYIKPSIFFSF